jgi:glycosyltransferase involved in cell wall biosynthesis
MCPELENFFALCYGGRFSEESIAADASVHWLGPVRVRQPLSIRRARRNLRDILRRESCDVVMTHSCWSQAIFGPAIRREGVPLGFYLHAPVDGRHWLQRWAKRSVPDFALTNSNFTASTLAQLYPGVRSAVVYCPVAPPQCQYSESDRSVTRAELETPEDATVIVQVSRPEEWKGHELHLEALSKLKDLSGWVCWQIGGPQRPGEMQYLARLKQKAISLGISERVRFLDQRSDVPRLLSAADIFCQPNTAGEPFGIVFIEALYAQLPVVTTDIGGAREIVDESCGVLVPPGDVRSLAAALRALIQEPALRSKLGSAGPARASALCDPAMQTNQFREQVNSFLRQT